MRFQIGHLSQLNDQMKSQILHSEEEKIGLAEAIQ